MSNPISVSMARTFHMNALVNNASGNFPHGRSNTYISRPFVSQLNIICSELVELLSALSAYRRFRDSHTLNEIFRDIRDGVADVIVTVDGMRHRMSIPPTESVCLPDNGETLASYLSVTLPALIDDLNIEHETITGSLFCKIEDGEMSLIPGTSYDLVRFWPIAESWPFLDLCYTLAYSTAHHFGIPVEADHEAVFKSNMSKFDLSLEDADRTKARYEAQGVAVHIETVHALDTQHSPATFYIVKSSKDQVVNGKDYPAGKFLKSINFKEPVFSPIPAPIL